jgi:hypothetical protein
VALAACKLISAAQLRIGIAWFWYGPGASNSPNLAIELLTTKRVYFHPGHFYDFPADGYLVVSLIRPEPVFTKGIELLLSMF